MRRYGALIVTADQAAPDARTTLADLRTALCIASGTALDDIDPAQGYDTSRRSFDAACTSWRQGPLGLTCERMRTSYERARAYWQARRPEWMADWPAVPPDEAERADDDFFFHRTTTGGTPS
jgi:hypothetical protein